MAIFFADTSELKNVNAHRIISLNGEKVVAHRQVIAKASFIGVTEKGLRVEGEWEGNLVAADVSASILFVWYALSEPDEKSKKHLLNFTTELIEMDANHVDWRIILEKEARIHATPNP